MKRTKFLLLALMTFATESAFAVTPTQHAIDKMGINGGTAFTVPTNTTPAASTFTLWDTNKNLNAASLIPSLTSTATAAGTTTLTVASNFYQNFTGTTTQTVKLPVATTMVNGQGYTVTNNSTGIVTVQTSGLNTIVAMAANSWLSVWVTSTAGGTGTASWNWVYLPSNLVGSAAFTYVGSGTSTSVYGGTNSSLSFTSTYTTVVGAGAGAALTTGQTNTFFGNTAGANISTTTDNTCVGYNTCQSVTGSGDTSVGSNANSTSGGTSLGYNSNASGAASVAIGYSASAGFSSLVFGSNSVGSNSDTASGQISFGQLYDGTTYHPLTDMYLGSGADGDQAAINVSINASPNTASNGAGGNMTIKPGNGAGTGGSGVVNIQTAPAGSTGVTPNTMRTGLSLSNVGVVTIGPTGVTPQHVLNTAVGTNGAGIATMTNLPTAATAGNATGWIQITINGATHYMPYW